MLLKYFSSPVKNGPFVLFLSGSENLTQHCLNLSTSFFYKSTLFYSTQVCDSFVFIIASLYRGETFSAHFIARLITERHFVAIYTCSEPWARHIHSLHAMPWHCAGPVVHAANSPTDLSIGHSSSMLRSRYTFAFLKKTGWLCSMNVLLFLGHIDTLPWLCKGVTAKHCVLQASDHTPQQLYYTILYYTIAYYHCCSSALEKNGTNKYKKQLNNNWWSK